MSQGRICAGLGRLRTKIGWRWAEEETLPTGGMSEELGGVLGGCEHKCVVKRDALIQILLVEKDGCVEKDRA